MKKTKRQGILLEAADSWLDELRYLIKGDCTKDERKSYKRQIGRLEVALREGWGAHQAKEPDTAPERQGISGWPTDHWQQGDLVEFRRIDGTFLYGVVERVEIGGSLQDQLIVRQPGSTSKFVWIPARCRLLRRNGVAAAYPSAD